MRHPKVALFYLFDGGTVKTLATGKESIDCMVADGRWLYWVERGSAIRRLEIKGVLEASGANVGRFPPQRSRFQAEPT